MDDFVQIWNIVHHPDNYKQRTDKDLIAMSRYVWQYAGVKAISVADGYLQSIQCPDYGLVVHRTYPGILCFKSGTRNDLNKVLCRLTGYYSRKKD